MISRCVVRAIFLLLLASGAACAQKVDDLEKEGDRLMELGQFELAKNFYKQGLKQNPQIERLWVKLERAMEGYYELVFTGKGPRGSSPSSIKGPRLFPAGAGTAPAASGASTDAMLGALGGAETTLPPGAGDEAGDPGETGAPPDDGGGSGAEETGEVAAVATPTPAPTPTAPAAPEIALRSPEEIIYVERPIRAGDTSPVQGREEGLPVVVQTAAYEVKDIRFRVDSKSTLHVTGEVKNVSDLDFRNPRVFLHLYDARLVQWILKVERLSNSPSVLFRGRTGKFDIPVTGFNNTVGAFRVYLSY